MRIVAISGSLRKLSYNTASLRAAAEVAPPGVEIVIYPLHDIPFYNEDVEKAGVPAPVAALLKAIGEADGVFFATPEYNHGYPGVLKNVLDWFSDPEPLDGKPVTVLSAAPSMGGGVRAQMALREVLYAQKVRLYGLGTDFLVRGATPKFDKDGKLTDAATREAIAKHVAGFVAFIEAAKTGAAV